MLHYHSCVLLWTIQVSGNLAFFIIHVPCNPTAAIHLRCRPHFNALSDFLLIRIYRSGYFNPAVVYDHLGEIYFTLVVGKFFVCILLYIKVSWGNLWNLVFNCKVVPLLQRFVNWNFCSQAFYPKLSPKIKVNVPKSLPTPFIFPKILKWTIFFSKF